MEEKIKHDTKIKATWRERECPVSAGLSGQRGPPAPPPTPCPHPVSLAEKGGGGAGPGPRRNLPPKWAVERHLSSPSPPSCPPPQQPPYIWLSSWILRGKWGSGGQSQSRSRQEDGKRWGTDPQLGPSTRRTRRLGPALWDSKNQRRRPRPVGRRSGSLRGQNYSTDALSLAPALSEMSQKLNLENGKQKS